MLDSLLFPSLLRKWSASSAWLPLQNKMVLFEKNMHFDVHPCQKQLLSGSCFFVHTYPFYSIGKETFSQRKKLPNQLPGSGVSHSVFLHSSSFSDTCTSICGYGMEMLFSSNAYFIFSSIAHLTGQKSSVLVQNRMPSITALCARSST